MKTATTSTNRRRTQRIASAAADVAIGGAALAADKMIEVARDVLPSRSDSSGNDDASSPYEERTRDELYTLAAERDIAGRSTMRKAELIEALRQAR